MAEGSINLSARLIVGGISRDVRGEVRHVNGFGFEQVDRGYIVRPSRTGEVRGWVGHRRDWKWYFAIEGAFDVGVVSPSSWERPSRNQIPDMYSLAAETPVILEIPPGLYAASVAIRPNSALMVFSSGLISEARTDDFRLPSDYWSLGMSADKTTGSCVS